MGSDIQKVATGTAHAQSPPANVSTAPTVAGAGVLTLSSKCVTAQPASAHVTVTSWNCTAATSGSMTASSTEPGSATLPRRTIRRAAFCANNGVSTRQDSRHTRRTATASDSHEHRHRHGYEHIHTDTARTCKPGKVDAAKLWQPQKSMISNPLRSAGATQPGTAGWDGDVVFSQSPLHATTLPTMAPIQKPLIGMRNANMKDTATMATPRTRGACRPVSRSYCATNKPSAHHPTPPNWNIVAPRAAISSKSPSIANGEVARSPLRHIDTIAACSRQDHGVLRETDHTTNVGTQPTYPELGNTQPHNAVEDSCDHDEPAGVGEQAQPPLQPPRHTPLVNVCDNGFAFLVPSGTCSSTRRPSTTSTIIGRRCDGSVLTVIIGALRRAHRGACTPTWSTGRRSQRTARRAATRSRHSG